MAGFITTGAAGAGVGTGPEPYPGNANPPPTPLVPCDTVIPPVPPLTKPVSPGARARRLCREYPAGSEHL